MQSSKHYNKTTKLPQEFEQAFQGKRKAQIISIPGIPLKEKYRYRVTLGHEILGDKLSFEQAAELAGLKVKGVNS